VGDGGIWFHSVHGSNFVYTLYVPTGMFQAAANQSFFGNKTIMATMQTQKILCVYCTIAIEKKAVTT
jgi:hypothetical protein